MSLGSRRFDVHLDLLGEISQRILCDWVETIKQQKHAGTSKNDVGFITCVCVLQDLFLVINPYAADLSLTNIAEAVLGPCFQIPGITGPDPVK